ncbi:3'-5' exonuclease [Escherichia coli]
MPLQAFLSMRRWMEAGEGQADTWQDAVQLMTLHSAKGLEFRRCLSSVWKRACSRARCRWDEGGRLEEERRLAYIA